MPDKNLSITTDYLEDTGDPEKYLRHIAEAGFTHIHWCHEWCTDYIYSADEVARIKRLLKSLGLRLNDLHASHGAKNKWYSTDENARQAGVELVMNRIEMVSELECDTIVLHLPEVSGENQWDSVNRSLEELEQSSLKHGVRIAFENLRLPNFSSINRIFSAFPPSFAGLCYDSGHGNLSPNCLDLLNELKGRLIALHLHDNDGTGDQHRILFRGTVDWVRLAVIIAESSYDKCVSLEVSMKYGEDADEKVFLENAFNAGMKFTDMMAQYG